MAKFSKILIGIILIGLLTAGAIVGYRLLYRQSSKMTVNLPGKLLGPKLNERAEKLDADEIIKWTNQYRQDNGLGPLAKNDLLTSAAQKKVEDMFSQNYFDHVSPAGQTPAALVSETGYNYKTTGENLALGDFANEKDLVDTWMASPGHRANILNSDYTEIGAASDLGEIENRTTWLAVQEFGKPAPRCAKPSQKLADEINSQKAQYQNLLNEFNNLTRETQDLANLANAKIKEGNEIYRQNKDAAEAEPSWQEGAKLREQSQAKYTEAQKAETQLAALYNEINLKVNQYNTQANNYNTCLK